MYDTASRAWLALHRHPDLTDSILRQLIHSTASPDQIFALDRPALEALHIPVPAQQALASLAASRPTAILERDWQILQQQQIQLLPMSDPHYPELLKQIDDPPPLLYVKGDTTLLNRPQLAMVGSRRNSSQAAENAYVFAAELARAGFVITSGLALGIDAHSHRGALAVGGATVGIVGTGVDVVYPFRNKQLFADIAERGAIVSEFCLGAPPHKHRFPRRNRIISGMSLGVLVVEAGLQSGSLISARCALEQGREVFAVPGSLQNPGSRGCHWLIQQGAKLVTSTADILEELRGWLPEIEPVVTEGDVRCSPDKCSTSLDQREAALMRWLGYDPVSIDLLHVRSGWSMAELAAVLVRLELKGLVHNSVGCYQRAC
jgi:DNA processing protein